jgi:hypothetical protein
MERRAASRQIRVIDVGLVARTARLSQTARADAPGGTMSMSARKRALVASTILT